MDLEEFHQSIQEWERGESESSNDWLESEKAVKKFLDLLDEENVKATFFALGSFIKKHPELMKKVKKRGHEVACHSWSHINLNKLSFKQINEALRKCEKAFSKINVKLKGFRAPYYSINAEVFDALIKHGYSYDSSIVPNVFYYLTRVMRVPKKKRLNKNELKKQVPYNIREKLVEFPFTSVPGYYGVGLTATMIRLLWPNSIIKKFLLKKEFLVFNSHPFEFTRDLRRNNAPWWINKNTGEVFERKFKHLIDFLKSNDYELIKMENALRVLKKC